MKIFRSPIFFIFFTAGLSKGLAIPLAALQWIGIRIKFNFPPAPITQNPYGLFYSLKMKWFTWVMQKYISLRLRLNPRAKSILKLVDQEFEVPVKGGCIIATLHSPWAKLLCAWSKENNFAMVVAA